MGLKRFLQNEYFLRKKHSQPRFKIADLRDMQTGKCIEAARIKKGFTTCSLCRQAVMSKNGK